MLHGELYDAVQKSGLERLYQLSVLAFAWSGQSLEALEILAGGAREAGDEFPLPAFTLRHIRSFAPAKWPSGDQLQEARAIWSRAAAERSSFR